MQNKKNRILAKRAFTLIELLIVIAIIGILAGVILVSTNSSRKNATDAAIITSANSIMKAIQVEAADDPTKFNNYHLSWINVSGVGLACTDLPSTSMVAACDNIITKIGSTGFTGATAYKLYIGLGNKPKFTIMVALPGAQAFYCIGSNGGTSKITTLNASGCGGGANGWKCSGCTDDPTGNGF
jgi:prepilin-type N-terminal cleavage/methylation domain-containing protein